MKSNFVWKERNSYGLVTGLSIRELFSQYLKCKLPFFSTALRANLKTKHKNKTKNKNLPKYIYWKG